MNAHIELDGVVIRFELFNLLDAPVERKLRVGGQIADHFLRTGDVRRSRLAQKLMKQGEEPAQRRYRSEAMFAWADTNSDGKLGLDELRQALSSTPDGGTADRGN